MKKRASIAEPLESRIAPATFTVSTSLDSGPGSFRQAILDANGAAGSDGIVFSFAGGSYTVIQPLSPLPALLGDVSIDGLIAGPDYQLPHVFLDGSLAGAGASGLTIIGDGVTVQRLAIGNFSAHGVRISGSGNYLAHNHIGTEFAGTAAAGNGGDGVIVESGMGNTIGVGLLHPNLISGNGGAGVHLAFGSTATTVSGNRIGLNYLGTAAIPNLNGVLIDGDSAGNIIGGTERNIISGNTDYGVKVNSTASGSTSAPTQFIQTNYIGTGMSGSGDFGNGKSGVYLLSTMAVRLEGNVISGNGTYGVEINSGSRHQLYGNLIGLDSAGASAIANTQTGVYVNGANLNIIGGQAAGAGNVISGNGLHGVNVLAGGSGNTALGNLIGTDKTGAVAIGNTGDGVRLQSVINTTIGGAGTNAGNVISGNGGDGVFVSGGTNAAGTTLKQNYIGTTSAGTGDLGNGGNGVQFSSVLGTATIGGSGSGSGNVIAGNGLSGILVGTADLLTIQGNTIGRSDAPNARGILINGSSGNGLGVGGISAGQGNNIGFNTGAGVAATGSANAGIRGNSIHDNGGLGIDLGNNGATPNDPLDADPGANGLLNFPALNSAIISAGSTQVSGTYAGLADTALTIDFYSNTANGEAETYLGSTTVTTDALGAAGFAATLPAVPAGRTISATANRVGSPLQTSEVSAQISPQAALTISDVALTEGSGGTKNFTFTITLGAASTGSVTVDYATADGTAVSGSDYLAASGTLTFTPGQTSKTVTVSVLGDLTAEPNETFFLNLSSATGAIISDAQGLGTITNDDTATVSIDDVTVSEGNAGAKNMVFTISLSAASAGAVTVDFATADNTAFAGSDYAAAAGTLTFAAGELTKTVAVVIIGDGIVEQNETFFLNLGNATGATIADAQGLGTIANDDTAFVTISDATIGEGNFGTTNAVFTVSLSAASASAITVDFVSVGDTALAGIDYVTAAGTLSFAAGETTKTISVPVIGDTAPEFAETFFVNLSNANGATISDAQGLGTIANDDTAFAIISDVTIVEGNSGTTNAVFTVSLSVASANAITVDFATADDTALAGSDYVTTTGTISFAAGETSKTISVPVIGDTTPEFAETFFVNLSNASGCTISDAQALGTISNDDIPFLSIADVTALESGVFTFAITLSQAHVLPVTFDFATLGGSAVAGVDFTGASGQLTIPAGETSAQITILVADENIVEGDEAFTVILSAPQNATIGDDTALATILNNDETLLTVESVLIPEGNSGTTNAVFVVSLTAPSASDVAFDFFTTDATARAGSDYTATTGSATIPAGATSIAISVPIIGDMLVGRDEFFSFEIENLSGATPAALIAGGVILNDDEGPVTISIADSSVIEANEGPTNLVFTVQLSVGFEYDITIGFATANGTASSPGDFAAGPDSFTIPAEATTAAVSVRVQADISVEPDETLTALLANRFGEDVIFGRSTATGTIVNDDYAFSISGGSYTESGDYQFTVTRTGVLDATVDFEFHTRAGTATADVDYATQNGSITFAPGETSITRSFALAQDSLTEIDETFFVDLTLPGGVVQLPGNGPILNGTAQIIILDDDGPTAHIETAKASSLEDGADDAGRIAFSIILSGPSTLPVSVHLRTNSGTATGADFVAIDEIITFAPGQTIFESVVSIRSDRFAEADEAFALRISDPQYAALGVDTLALSIRDNDGLIISKNRKSATWRDLDGDLVTLKVTKPVLTPALFGFRFGGPIFGAPEISGQLLESLDIADAGIAANGMSLKFAAKLKDGLGDKFVNVGAIDALGVRLGSVVLPGDLGKIEAGDSGIPVESTKVGKTALKGLSIRSMGALGASTQGPLGHLQSFIAGKLGALKITGDFADAELTIAGGSGALTVGGNLRGGDGSGIHANGKVASVRILGDMLGDAPDDTVSLVTYAGKITIGGRVENAEIRAAIVAALSVAKEWTASSFTALRIASIVVGGEVNGTAVGGDSFQFVASQISSMKVAGSKLPLTKGIDDLTIGATLDVRVRETVA